MSRTYRKTSLTERKSLEKYVEEELFWKEIRSYYHEYYFTKEGNENYKKAFEEYLVKLERWQRGFDKEYPKEPYPYEFKKKRVVFKDIDLEAEKEKAIKRYKRNFRDGQFSETGLNQTYKKYYAKYLRVKNRALISQILKDDERWEQKPYPDTYFHKQYIWDYW